MKALILDTETTGLTPPPTGTDQAIEVGCVLYDLVLAAPVTSFASLIHADANPAETINRIPVAALRSAPPADNVWSYVRALAGRAEVILAHRADFDRAFVPAGVTGSTPWVCTKFHVDWVHGKPGDHLVHLALAHGVGVLDAHRALTDCETLSRLLTRAHQQGQDLVRLVQRAMRPRVKVQALVSYDDRDKAKAAGFAWDPAARQWLRDMPKEDVGTLPFKVREVS